jgi:hypothetical protein
VLESIKHLAPANWNKDGEDADLCDVEDSMDGMMDDDTLTFVVGKLKDTLGCASGVATVFANLTAAVRTAEMQSKGADDKVSLAVLETADYEFLAFHPRRYGLPKDTADFQEVQIVLIPMNTGSHWYALVLMSHTCCVRISRTKIFMPNWLLHIPT